MHHFHEETSLGNYRDNVVEIFSYIHKSVEETSSEYFSETKMRNYITPFSFLEFIKT